MFIMEIYSVSLLLSSLLYNIALTIEETIWSWGLESEVSLPISFVTCFIMI
jgi:hypothetical protein